MELEELSNIFRSSGLFTDNCLLVTPPDCGKLLGKTISGIHVFMIVGSGSMTVTINGKEYKMQACSFTDLLEWNTIRITAISPNLEAYCLFHDQTFVKESLNSLKPFPENYLREMIKSPVLSISGKEYSILAKQVQDIALSLYSTKHLFRQELIQSQFKILVLEFGNIVSEHYEEKKKDANLNKYDIITIDFLKLVWKHFRTEHNIRFYADELGISEKHLSRVIKNKLGKTPHNVILDELTQYAVTLLQDPQISILEISIALHFSEHAAFCKFFKKQMNISPSEFRKNING